MDFDPDFWVVQDLSVAVPDAPFDVDLGRDDVDGRGVVVGVGVAVVWRRREGELFDPVDLNEWQIEGALVHVAGPIKISEIIQARGFSNKNQVKLKKEKYNFDSS